MRPEVLMGVFWRCYYMTVVVFCLLDLLLAVLGLTEAITSFQAVLVWIAAFVIALLDSNLHARRYW